jgi:hypothetical protein
MASITVPSVSTLPVAGADIIAEPLNGWITNIRSFIEGNNIDKNNVNSTDATLGIATLADAQTFTALKTLENVEAASGGVRTGLIIATNPTSGTAADNDGIEVQFKGDNDGGSSHIFGEIECVFTDVSNTSEDATLNFKTYAAGSETTPLALSTSATFAVPIVSTTSITAGSTTLKTTANAAGSVQNLATLEWDPADGSNLTDNSSGVGITFTMPDDGDTQHVFANLDVLCVADNNGAEKGEFSFKVAASGASAEKMTLSTDALTVTPTLVLSTVAAAGEDTDKFLVLDSSGNVDYRTGTQLASDIGAVTSVSYPVTAINNATADELVTVGATTTELDAEANLTYNDTNGLILQSATASKPVFTIQNTNNGATSGTLKFVNDKGGAGANSDVCGTIDFYGDDANQDQINFAKIEGIVANATNGQEGGKLALSVASHDGESNVGFFITDGSVEDEVDATIGNGSASVTTIAGTLTMGSTAAMTNVGLVSVANQSNITGLGTISSGTWQSTPIASAYLDPDTAHLTTNQTFTGNKTFTGTVTTGVDDTGVDVKFFGASAGAYMLWDESADTLEIRGKSADSATSQGTLLLSTALNNINDNDRIGQIDFQTPLESGGTDAVLVGARIHAEAEATFAADNNTTAIVFSTNTTAEATERFRITGAGAFTGAGDIESTSDIRTKENIKPIENALEIVSKIRGVTFNKKDTPDKESVGVIAQEVEEAGLTQAVSENHEGMKTVAYGNMVGLLIEAIKDQQKQIDELKEVISNGS